MSTCLATLDDPGAVVRTDWLDDGPVSTPVLLTIYRRRTRHVEDIGLSALGFAETVRRLEETPHEALLLVAIEGPSGHPHCLVLLTPGDLSVVAALAVLAPPPLS